MLRKLALLTAGAGLTVLGLIGLVLPVLPGLLLLAGAVSCFSLASPRFHQSVQRRLQRHPRYHRLMRRWRSGRHLPLATRLRLAFWLTLDGVRPSRR